MLSQGSVFLPMTLIYLKIKSESDCRQLQDDLHSLKKWESDWRMEFNPSKCKRYTGNTRTYTFQISVQTSWQSPKNCWCYWMFRDLPLAWFTLEYSCKWNYDQSKQDSELSTPQSPHLFGQIQRTSIQSSSETNCWIQCHCLGPLRS